MNSMQLRVETRTNKIQGGETKNKETKHTLLRSPRRIQTRHVVMSLTDLKSSHTFFAKLFLHNI